MKEGKHTRRNEGLKIGFKPQNKDDWRLLLRLARALRLADRSDIDHAVRIMEGRRDDTVFLEARRRRMEAGGCL